MDYKCILPCELSACLLACLHAIILYTDIHLWYAWYHCKQSHQQYFCYSVPFCYVVFRKNGWLSCSYEFLAQWGFGTSLQPRTCSLDALHDNESLLGSCCALGFVLMFPVIFLTRRATISNRIAANTLLGSNSIAPVTASFESSLPTEQLLHLPLHFTVKLRSCQRHVYDTDLTETLKRATLERGMQLLRWLKPAYCRLIRGSELGPWYVDKRPFHLQHIVTDSSKHRHGAIHIISSEGADVGQAHHLSVRQPGVADTFTGQEGHNAMQELQSELGAWIVEHMPVVVITGVWGNLHWLGSSSCAGEPMKQAL
jgi:hypothetical protein